MRRSHPASWGSWAAFWQDALRELAEWLRTENRLRRRSPHICSGASPRMANGPLFLRPEVKEEPPREQEDRTLWQAPYAAIAGWLVTENCRLTILRTSGSRASSSRPEQLASKARARDPSRTSMPRRTGLFDVPTHSEWGRRRLSILTQFYPAVGYATAALPGSSARSRCRCRSRRTRRQDIPRCPERDPRTSAATTSGASPCGGRSWRGCNGDAPAPNSCFGRSRYARDPRARLAGSAYHSVHRSQVRISRIARPRCVGVGEPSRIPLGRTRANFDLSR